MASRVPEVPAEWANRLRAAEERYAGQIAALELERSRARAERAAVFAAAAAAGLSRRQIGDLLGLTRARVQQLVDAG